MAFCKFANDETNFNYTMVSNNFITSFLPSAKGDYIKVYLYGLYLCNAETRQNNNEASNNFLESFATAINLTEKEVLQAFNYFQTEGLVEIINTEPKQIRFLPMQKLAIADKKFSTGKYGSFNAEMQNLLERQITPTEYNQYYEIIEVYGIEPEMLVMVAAHATELKGKAVGAAYINTHAKNAARKGVKTTSAYEQELLEQEKVVGKLADLFHELKIMKQPDFDDKDNYLTLTKTMKFLHSDLITIAGFIKVKSFNKFFEKLKDYFNEGLTTSKEISRVENAKKEVRSLSQAISKSLGQYVENLQIVDETYTRPWLEMGFEESFLKLTAKECFKKNIRTFEGMQNELLTQKEKGITNEETLKEQTAKLSEYDKDILEIFKAVNLTRKIENADRSFYNTWKFSNNQNKELILYAAAFARDKQNAMAYLNKILTTYKNDGITTVAAASNKGDKFGQVVISTTYKQSVEKKKEVSKSAFQKEMEYKQLLQNNEFKKLDTEIRTKTITMAKLKADGVDTATLSNEIQQLEKKKEELSDKLLNK
jgi:DnaD/phage-associated family protein